MNRRTSDTLRYRLKTFWTPMLAFLVLAAAGMFAIQREADNNAQRLYDALVQSCERVNELRHESNARIVQQRKEARVLVLALRAAAEQSADTPENRDIYRKLEDDVRGIRYSFVKIPICREVIPKP